MGRKGRPTPPELVARLVEIGTGVLASQLDVPEAQAQAAMREVAYGLCQEYGGQRLNIPQDLQYPLGLRDARLWAMFAGNNVADLAAEFGITEQQVRNIIKHKRRQEAARKQVGLPGFDPGPGR